MPYLLSFGRVRHIAYPRKSIHIVTATILHEVSYSNLHTYTNRQPHYFIGSADCMPQYFGQHAWLYISLSCIWTKEFANQASWNLHALLPWSCMWSRMYQNLHGLARSNSVFSLSLSHRACLLSLFHTPSYRLGTGNHSVTVIITWRITQMPAEKN